MQPLVIINSKIIVSDKPLSYSTSRSIYTPDERFEQTIESIASVRNSLPEAKLLLLDNSILESRWKRELENTVDFFINPFDDNELKFDTDYHPTKAVGELAQLIRIFEFLKSFRQNWSRIYKLTGRYRLNDDFDSTIHKDGMNIVRIHDLLLRHRLFQPNEIKITSTTLCFYTSFYSISPIHFDQYVRNSISLYNTFKNNPSLQNEPLEAYQFLNLPNTLPVKTIGATGRFACEANVFPSI